MRKPGGYDFVIGERGQALSGGERQRLAIARALLKDAPILLLDEATSALDTETEARIKRALDAARAGRTTFVIAHRLSTIVDADLIVVLDQGRIVEQGRFDELARGTGPFARLVTRAASPCRNSGRQQPCSARSGRDGSSLSPARIWSINRVSVGSSARLCCTSRNSCVVIWRLATPSTSRSQSVHGTR